MIKWQQYKWWLLVVAGATISGALWWQRNDGVVKVRDMVYLYDQTIQRLLSTAYVGPNEEYKRDPLVFTNYFPRFITNTFGWTYLSGGATQHYMMIDGYDEVVGTNYLFQTRYSAPPSLLGVIWPVVESLDNQLYIWQAWRTVEVSECTLDQGANGLYGLVRIVPFEVMPTSGIGFWWGGFNEFPTKDKQNVYIYQNISNGQYTITDYGPVQGLSRYCFTKDYFLRHYPLPPSCVLSGLQTNKQMLVTPSGYSMFEHTWYPSLSAFATTRVPVRVVGVGDPDRSILRTATIVHRFHYENTYGVQYCPMRRWPWWKCDTDTIVMHKIDQDEHRAYDLFVHGNEVRLEVFNAFVDMLFYLVNYFPRCHFWCYGYLAPQVTWLDTTTKDSNNVYSSFTPLTWETILQRASWREPSSPLSTQDVGMLSSICSQMTDSVRGTQVIGAWGKSASSPWCRTLAEARQQAEANWEAEEWHRLDGSRVEAFANNYQYVCDTCTWYYAGLGNYFCTFQSDLVWTGTPRYIDCYFVADKAGDDFYGGGVYNEGTNVIIGTSPMMTNRCFTLGLTNKVPWPPLDHSQGNNIRNVTIVNRWSF